MKKQRKNEHKKIWMGFFITCGLFTLGCAKTGETGQEVATLPSASAGGALAPEVSYFEELESASAVPMDQEQKPLRARAVKANVEALKKALISGRKSIRLDLFSDREIPFVVDQVQIISKQNLVATGHIEGKELSSVTLVIRNGVVVATIHTGEGGHYSVEYAAKGAHVIQEVGEPEHEDCSEPVAAPPATDEDQLLGGQAATGAKVIDMLVAYTPAARAKVGGATAMLAKIQMGIADTNKAFTASGVKLQVRLAGTLETRQNETGNFSTDLSRLKGKTDGQWDEVHAKRKAIGADQVTLVGVYAGQSTAGIGYIKATASSAFTVVKYTAFTIYTFSHELGHNIGLQHSDGYVNSTARFRTIMAYGSVPRVLRFSNPSLPYLGFKAGSTSQNSSAKLNLYGGTTAAFYPAMVGSSTAMP
jgi:hypothetical protein